MQKYLIIDAKNAYEMEIKVNKFMEENYNTRIGSLVVSNSIFFQVVYFLQEDLEEEK